MYGFIFQQLFWESLGDFFYFPIWWYTLGALRSGKWCFELFKVGNYELAPGLWFANIFVPMFGQYDWQGRIISFVMRVVQIVFRCFGSLVWGIFCVILFLFWLILPIAVVYGFIQTLVVR